MRLKGIAFNGMRSSEASSEKCSNGLVGGQILFCSYCDVTCEVQAMQLYDCVKGKSV